MTEDQITAKLQEFEKDPKKVMGEHPPKGVDQEPGSRGLSTLFSQRSIKDGDYIDQRDRYRKKLSMEVDGQIIRLEQILPGRAPFERNDRAENVVDNASSLVRTLEAMEAKNLRRAKLPSQPWSDWYWPIYQGVLGARYADPSFPIDSEDWKEKHNYVLARPASSIVSSGNQEAINRLSPGEKYDLLIGDRAFSLTASGWREGQGYYDASGKVERWMGICHGWAPAAYMIGRPSAALQVMAADGKTKILFYPSDIKALASLAWAKNQSPTRFIGGRCNDKNPEMDENGRVRSTKCFDTNPGTWHLAVVNQIGVAQRSFIIDATFDYEVWNQPVQWYSYSYFNPKTRRAARSLAEARVPMNEFTNDKFRSYRSQNARFVVGIAMKIGYVAETMPTTAQSDGPQADYIKTVNYLYDVELDGSGNILGGEWYNNFHPDFLWTPPPGVIAEASSESSAQGEWSDDTIPQSWQRAAIAAARYGQPLYKIVSALVKMSRSLSRPG